MAGAISILQGGVITCSRSHGSFMVKWWKPRSSTSKACQFSDCTGSQWVGIRRRQIWGEQDEASHPSCSGDEDQVESETSLIGAVVKWILTLEIWPYNYFPYNSHPVWFSELLLEGQARPCLPFHSQWSLFGSENLFLVPSLVRSHRAGVRLLGSFLSLIKIVFARGSITSSF